MKQDIEGMKQLIWSHSRVVQVLENIMGQESLLLHSQRITKPHSDGW